MYRQMYIKWVYDYKALVDEIGADTLAELDFMEGDYSYSNHGQQVNVYNVIGPCNEKKDLIEFEYDGEILRKKTTDENEGEQKEPPAKKQKIEQPIRQLPRHEFIVMQFLQSYKAWTDTKYGRDLYFVINSLMSMGQLVH